MQPNHGGPLRSQLYGGHRCGSGKFFLAEERLEPIALQLWDELHGNVADAGPTRSGDDSPPARSKYLESDWINIL